jgi:nucleotide sugar dehydrogenase
MNIAVIGMGKIGLPLAVQYAKKGNSVIGVDINPKTVESINQGLEPFPEEAYLGEYLRDVVSKQVLRATLDYSEAIKSADVIVVVVPLFVNEKAEPDFVEMDKATELIGANIKKGSLICYETTLPIGTTRTRFVPLLEKNSGMKVGIDFHVVFSPERVFTGRIFEDLKKYPKIVGGVTRNCTDKGIIFYEKVLDFDIRDDLAKPNGVWEVESAESAEFVKLAETTYRDVNIALANQFAMYSDRIGINIYEVIESANSQNFSHVHQPGISVGGHCIPVYPQFYLWGDTSAAIVKEARTTNTYMPRYAVKRMINVLGDLNGKNILVLGLSYRANVKESAFSGCFELNKELKKCGAKIEVIDPLFSNKELEDFGLKSYSGKNTEVDGIIIHTNHMEFTSILKSPFPNCKAIIDGRNFLKNIQEINSIPIFSIGGGTIK